MRAICWSVLILAAVAGGAPALAQNYKPSAESTAAIPVAEARRDIRALYKGQVRWSGNMNTNVSLTGVAARSEGLELTVSDNNKGLSKGAKLILAWKDIGNLEVLPRRGGLFARSDEVQVTPNQAFAFKTPEEARRFSDALFVVRRAYVTGSSIQDTAQFDEIAAKYRTAGAKPEFPEFARRFRVQAEAALRDKEFEDASDFYDEALKTAPWWPEGRFNRALILGELKEYREAAAEMKKYLALVPDAANARAAQDKIYEWEGRAGRK
jgi:tetratricopeptide (TPR) repeat protein